MVDPVSRLTNGGRNRTCQKHCQAAIVSLHVAVVCFEDRCKDSKKTEVSIETNGRVLDLGEGVNVVKCLKGRKSRGLPPVLTSCR